MKTAKKGEKMANYASMKPMTLDDTLTRYQVDQFKSAKGSKQVPFEKLDFSIYKPSANMVAYTTSEERILLWIKALYQRYIIDLQKTNGANMWSRWEEQESYNDTSKCDKVILYFEHNSSSIISITIYTSTGRIHIQGQDRVLKEWGNIEFPALLATTYSNLLDFLKLITTPSTISNLTSTPEEKTSKDMKNEKKNEEKTTPQIIQSPDTTPRERFFYVVKSNLATLESDFVELKQDLLKKIEDAFDLIKSKDEEITELKEKLNSEESKQNAMQQTISDLTLMLHDQKDETSKLKTSVKKSQSEFVELKIKINTLSSNTHNVPEQPSKNTDSQHNKTSTSETTNIPTSNKYSVLDDESSEKKENNPRENEGTLNTPNNEQFHTKICSSETVILCDSNGQMIDTKLLCPDTTCTYIRCPTFPTANEIIKQTHFVGTKTVILHSGTNDLETASDDESLSSSIVNVVEAIIQKLPNCKIIVSSLLPWLDKLHHNIGIVNQLVKDKLQHKKNVHLITHNNLFPLRQPSSR
ncbi:Hypothetical predicted protein [Paramuricea clavata]|uniref:Uncharacterized protein n=1 Tax=Paramuricea clavata TaxID=317549 RepID=A0A7D9E1N6_PARCT|nr:Hypothetical predicted protein [Paramuricea clavata]